MKEPDFFQPRRLAEALQALSRKGKIVPIAGGTNLLVRMKAAPVEADLIVDLSRIDVLREMGSANDVTSLGACVTLARLVEWHPTGAIEDLIRPMASSFAAPLVRNLATVGGNLCDASPAADLSPPLLALGAKVELESARHGSRRLPLEDFFLGSRRTARRPDELLTRIEIPRPHREARSFYYKLGRRKADAISIVSVAMILRMKETNVEEVRIALGAVAPVAIRARKAEEILRGETPSASTIQAAAAAAAAESRPIDDFRAVAAYRRDMVEALVRRGLGQMAAY